MKPVDEDALRDVKIKRHYIEFLYEEIQLLESELLAEVDDILAGAEIKDKCFYKRDTFTHTLVKAHEVSEAQGKVCVEVECFMIDEQDGETSRYPSYHIDCAEFQKYSEIPNDLYEKVTGVYTDMSRKIVSAIKAALAEPASA